MYQSKLFAFITSGWLAVSVISVLLAIVYVLIKIPKESQVVEATPVVVPEVTTPKPVKSKHATNKVAAKAINTTMVSNHTPILIPSNSTELKPEPETQFDRDLINFESKL
jgi:hypothetical protein